MSNLHNYLQYLAQVSIWFAPKGNTILVWMSNAQKSFTNVIPLKISNSSHFPSPQKLIQWNKNDLSGGFSYDGDERKCNEIMYTKPEQTLRNDDTCVRVARALSFLHAG